MRLFCTALFLLFVADVSYAGVAYAGGTCLNMSRATLTSFVSGDEMLVRTRDDGVYKVRFRPGCSAGRFPRTYFVYEPWTFGACLKRGMAFTTNHHGICVVDEVTQQAG